MAKTLLFLPDISGFTDFVQNTEIQHSQHVIAELLEVMIDSNTIGLELAEVEGDALFFFREELPSMEQLLAQIENTFTAFYSHLKLLKENRVCPCNACLTAPNLQLKIIAHCGDVEFITVQGKRKPFGKEVIEAHRLMKNDIESDNYTLISHSLSQEIMLSLSYQSKLYQFNNGDNIYDQKKIEYIFSTIDKDKLQLKPFATAKKIVLKRDADICFNLALECSAEHGMEWVSNYAKRHLWVDNVDEYIYDVNEVTRLGTEHVCVINGKHLNFITITKSELSHQNNLIYGEMTDGPPVVDKVMQFYTFNAISEKECTVFVEVYLETKSILKKIIKVLVMKRLFKENLGKSILKLAELIKEENLKQNNY